MEKKSEGGKGQALLVEQHQQQHQQPPPQMDEQARRANLPKHAKQDVHSHDQPWPMPVVPEELTYWLDVLGDYTESAPARKEATEGQPTSTPVNIKEYVTQGKCQHADLYLGLILNRLQSWSRGGISQGMVDEAFRLGADRSGFASLLYQIVDGQVWAKAERNSLYMDAYASLFIETAKRLKLPNMEFAVHNGHDLPVMRKHEVHPMFAYASADAYAEMLLPCPWYVLPAANDVRDHPDWKPLDLESFKARQTKLFWRGSPNDFVPYRSDDHVFAPRIKLAEESVKHPDLVDAVITSSLSLLGSLGHEKECELYKLWGTSPPENVKECNIETVEKYRDMQEKRKVEGGQDAGSRYTLNIDGTGHSERYLTQLLSNQLVFKVDTPFYNYYSRFFVPYEHYIPVKYDLSDLAEKVTWANEHVEEAHRIMVQASTRAHELFHPDEVACYTGLALAAYGRLLSFQPKEPHEGAQMFE